MHSQPRLTGVVTVVVSTVLVVARVSTMSAVAGYATRVVVRRVVVVSMVVASGSNLSAECTLWMFVVASLLRTRGRRVVGLVVLTRLSDVDRCAVGCSWVVVVCVVTRRTLQLVNTVTIMT